MKKHQKLSIKMKNIFKTIVLLLILGTTSCGFYKYNDGMMQILHAVALCEIQTKAGEE